MASHSSTLAWRIPWTGEPGGLQSMGSPRVRHDWATSLSLFTFMHWRRKWQPTPVLLPGEFHGRGSLVGCSLWGHEESDTTERLHFHFSLSCTGVGNGNPLQCSCLENPRDRGAWWAAVYGVAQSGTRLKQLSSSSMSRPILCSTAWEYLVRNLYQSSWSEKANWTLRPVLSKKTANKEGKDSGNSELRQKHCFHTLPSMFNSEFSQASTNRSISKQQVIRRIFVMLYGFYKHTVVL